MKIMKTTNIVKWTNKTIKDKDIPIILAELVNVDTEEMRFWCSYCKEYHYHKGGPGHRSSHCRHDSSPWAEDYIIILSKEDDLKLAKHQGYDGKMINVKWPGKQYISIKRPPYSTMRNEVVNKLH